MVASHPATVEEKRHALLAARLRPVDPGPVSPVVPLRAGGPGTPLFLVHAVGGSVAPYVALAALLGDDRPVYGIEDPGLHGGEDGDRALPATAAAYAAAVREVRPDGPVLLGGWSAGGAVACEMARHDPGVAAVFVLDTGLPERPIEAGDDELRAWFAADLAGMGVDPDSAAGRYPVFAANVRAFLAHTQSRVDTRVVSLCAAEDSAPEYLERRAALSDAVDLVPGDHYTMLRTPHIEALADVLRHRLNEVR